MKTKAAANKFKARVKSRVKPVAAVTVRNAPDMTFEGRREVANWIRRQADYLESSGGGLHTRFAARYFPSPKVVH